MNNAIAQELEILWSDFEQSDVDQKLEAFERLKSIAQKEDLQQLIEALKSDRSDFWVRELLSEPISGLGGSEYLPELFDALQKNYDEGHDNDGFHHFLTEIAWAEPQICRDKLEEMLAEKNFRHKEVAEWLLGFCE